MSPLSKLTSADADDELDLPLPLNSSYCLSPSPAHIDASISASVEKVMLNVPKKALGVKKC